MSKLYNEIELSSEKLDQKPSKLKRKIFLLTSPRTGSFMLCRALINYGFGVPHEYFHSFHIPTFGPRYGLPALSNPDLVASDPELRKAYINALIEHRTVNGVFAAKIHYHQYDFFLNNPEGAELLSNSYLIHLYRDDLLGQAISSHYAICSSKWGFDNTATAAIKEKPNYFDLDSIDHEMQFMVNERIGWDLLFAKNGLKPISVSLEELQTDVKGFLDRVAEDIGIKPVITDPDLDEPAYPDVALGMPPKKEARKRYLDDRRRIVQNENLWKSLLKRKSSFLSRMKKPSILGRIRAFLRRMIKG